LLPPVVHSNSSREVSCRTLVVVVLVVSNLRVFIIYLMMMMDGGNCSDTVMIQSMYFYDVLLT